MLNNISADEVSQPRLWRTSLPLPDFTLLNIASADKVSDTRDDAIKYQSLPHKKSNTYLSLFIITIS